MDILINLLCNILYQNVIDRWLNIFHIYTFTFVSVYIFSCLLYENKRYREFKSFLIVKVKRLLIPYVFTVVIWAATWNYFFFNSKRGYKQIFLGVSPL